MITINTSIKQVPALFNKVYMPIEGTILNFGCGRYPDLVEEAFPLHSFMHFDPYFDRVEENEAYVHTDLMDMLWYVGTEKKFGGVVVMCANVLNVLTDDELKDTIMTLNILAFEGFLVHISIYEGDRSGVGKKTSRGYQRNQKAVEYTRYFDGLFVKRKGNILTVSKGEI